MSSIPDTIPGSVGYIYPMFIELTITWVPSGFSGYIWLAHKNCVKKTSCPRELDDFSKDMSETKKKVSSRKITLHQFPWIDNPLSHDDSPR